MSAYDEYYVREEDTGELVSIDSKYLSVTRKMRQRR